MKKSILVLGLALAGAAGAQNLQVNVGGALTSGSLGFNFGIGFQDITTIGGQAVDGRIQGEFGGASNAISALALLNYPSGSLNLYAGGGLGVGLGGTSNQLFATIVGGLNAPLADQLGLFVEGGIRFNSPSVVRFGVTYNF